MTRKVSKSYGILNDEYQFAHRTTFVVDKQDIIQHVEEGKSAVDPKAPWTPMAPSSSVST